MLEKTLDVPLDCKEIQTVHPKGDQSWVFIGKTDAEVETPILPHSRVFMALFGSNWCFQTVVLEKTPESPLDSKQIKPVNLKGNHS